MDTYLLLSFMGLSVVILIASIYLLKISSAIEKLKKDNKLPLQ